MKRTLLLVLPLALAGILVFMLAKTSADTVPVAEPDADTEASAPQPDAIVTETENPGAETETAVERTSGEDRTPAPAAGLATLKGRAIAAETGAPLASATVRLLGRVRDRDDPEAEAVAWQDPERITTGADGIFELRFAPPPTHRFSLTATAADRVRMTRSWDELQPMALDLGDIPMTAGAEVAGVVRDEEGKPAAGVRIGLRAESRHDEGSGLSYAMSATGGTTAADGSFRSSRSLLPGEWNVSLSSDDYELVEPETFTVPEGQGSVSLSVTAHSLLDQPTIRGIVVDEAGVPVQGVDLVASEGPFAHFENRARSGADGTFTIRKKEGGNGPVRLQRGFPGPYTLVADDREFPWGTEDIRVVVMRPRTVRIAVVATETGKPVEDYAVRILPRDGARSSADDRMRTTGHHPGGASVVEGIRMGRHVAVVFPEDETFLTSRFQEFEVGDQGADLRFEVDRPLPLTVQLVSAGGSTVSGSRVQLLRKEGGEGELEFDTLSGTPEEAYYRFSTSGPVGIILADGTTDGDGRVVLEGTPSTGDLAVKALGPGHIPLIRTGLTLTRDSPVLTLQVSTGATLTGTVIPGRVLEFLGPGDRILGRPTDNPRETYATYYPAILLTSPDRGEQYPQGQNEAAPIQEDGSFTLGGIPPGTWNLVLRYFVSLERDGSSGTWATQELQSLSLRDGENRTLDLDLSALIPGTLSGQIFLDGELYAEKGFALQKLSMQNGRLVPGLGSLSGLTTDAQGRFAEDLLPGTYRVSLMAETVDPFRYSSIAGTQLVELQPGRTAEQVFHVVHRILRVRILESDGAPAVERWISSPYQRMQEVRTDPEGWVVLDPAPLESFSFSTWAKGMKQDDVRQQTGQDYQELGRRTITLGPVQMPAGQEEAEVTLRLPPGRQ